MNERETTNLLVFFKCTKTASIIDTVGRNNYCCLFIYFISETLRERHIMTCIRV